MKLQFSHEMAVMEETHMADMDDMLKKIKEIKALHWFEKNFLLSS